MVEAAVRQYKHLQSSEPSLRENEPGGVDPDAPWKTRASQRPLIKPYVRMSRIRLPSMFTVQTLNRLDEAPPEDSTAPDRDGTEAHPGTRATMPAGGAHAYGPTSARVAD